MKVRIDVTVDIDQQAWAEEFLLEPNEVRKDVRVYFRGLVLEQLSDLGLAKQDTAAVTS